MGQLLAAVSLGLAGGLSPGPLHSLILATSLRRGPGAGARLALAPLLSDAPPVVLSIVVGAALPVPAIRLMAVVGGAFVIWLGVGSLRATAEVGAEPGPTPHGDVLRAALVNLLNPNPWLFWLGAGAPLLRAAFGAGPAVGVGWLVLFYVALCGAKAGFAVAVGRSRHRLGPRLLRGSMVASAVLLMGVGVWLIARGLVGEF